MGDFETDRQLAFMLVVAALIVLAILAAMKWLGRAAVGLIVRMFRIGPILTPLAETQPLAEVMPPAPVEQVHAALLTMAETRPWYRLRDDVTVRLATRTQDVPRQRTSLGAVFGRAKAVPVQAAAVDDDPVLFDEVRGEFGKSHPLFTGTGTTRRFRAGAAFGDRRS